MAFEEITDLEPEQEDLQTIESDTDELIRQAAFGDAIRVATSNPALELVLTRAQASYLEAVKEFVTLDLSAPNGLHHAMRCQNDMNRYTDMVEWINIAVNEGKKADAELKRRRKEQLKNRGMKAYYGSEPTD